MSLPFLNMFRASAARRPDEAVIKDAEALLREWGEGAYDRATYLSWEEDFGIAPTTQAGHWWRVRREVARRLDRQENEPRAEFAA